MAGSLTSVAFRPPPGRRMRSVHSTRFGLVTDCGGVAGVVGNKPNCSNSRIPERIVGRDIPVALATRVTPPRPNAIASEAAQRRLIRSSIEARSISHFCLTMSMSDMLSPFGAVDRAPPPWDRQLGGGLPARIAATLKPYEPAGKPIDATIQLKGTSPERNLPVGYIPLAPQQE